MPCTCSFALGDAGNACNIEVGASLRGGARGACNLPTPGGHISCLVGEWIPILVPI